MAIICRGRDWPNAPRSHQGGSVGRPWAHVITLQLPPTLVYPYAWEPIDFYPAAVGTWSYGKPEWRPLQQPVDWWWSLYQYYTPGDWPYPWGQYVENYHYPTGEWYYWGVGLLPAVQPPDVFLAQGGSSWWYDGPTPIPCFAAYKPYGALPADFCIGEH